MLSPAAWESCGIMPATTTMQARNAVLPPIGMAGLLESCGEKNFRIEWERMVNERLS
jgi:hypothetical protein